MPKLILRLIAVLLVSTLTGDPVVAHAFSSQRSFSSASSASFEKQAFALPLLTERLPQRHMAFKRNLSIVDASTGDAARIKNFYIGRIKTNVLAMESSDELKGVIPDSGTRMTFFKAVQRLKRVRRARAAATEFRVLLDRNPVIDAKGARLDWEVFCNPEGYKRFKRLILPSATKSYFAVTTTFKADWGKIHALSKVDRRAALTMLVILALITAPELELRYFNPVFYTVISQLSFELRRYKGLPKDIIFQVLRSFNTSAVISAGRQVFEDAHPEVLQFNRAAQPKPAWEWMDDPEARHILGKLYVKWVRLGLLAVTHTLQRNPTLTILQLKKIFSDTIIKLHRDYNLLVLTDLSLPLAIAGSILPLARAKKNESPKDALVRLKKALGKLRKKRSDTNLTEAQQYINEVERAISDILLRPNTALVWKPKLKFILMKLPGLKNIKDPKVVMATLNSIHGDMPTLRGLEKQEQKVANENSAIPKREPRIKDEALAALEEIRGNVLFLSIRDWLQSHPQIENRVFNAAGVKITRESMALTVRLLGSVIFWQYGLVPREPFPEDYEALVLRPTLFKVEMLKDKFWNMMLRDKQGGRKQLEKLLKSVDWDKHTFGDYRYDRHVGNLLVNLKEHLPRWKDKNAGNRNKSKTSKSA